MPTRFPLAVAALLVVLLPACAPKKDGVAAAAEVEVPASTGSFTVDGKSHAGKVSVQQFPATGQFSVVCQDDAFGFVQITFSSEADARKPQTVKLEELSPTKANAPGTAHLSLSPFSGAETGSRVGSATISHEGAHHVVKFENVELSDKASSVKKTVSGSVAY